jgi:hypothetical protein
VATPTTEPPAATQDTAAAAGDAAPPAADSQPPSAAAAITGTAAEVSAPATSDPAPDPEPDEPSPPGEEARRSGRGTRAGRPLTPDERGLRDLVGAGPSQVGVSGALRARDVDRPTDEDLAQAERDVVLVRRHWKPPS